MHGQNHIKFMKTDLLFQILRPGRVKDDNTKIHSG